MTNLFLSKTEKAALNHSVEALESKNGTVIYNSIYNASRDDCKRWDCSISCYCANSYR